MYELFKKRNDLIWGFRRKTQPYRDRKKRIRHRCCDCCGRCVLSPRGLLRRQAIHSSRVLPTVIWPPVGWRDAAEGGGGCPVTFSAVLLVAGHLAAACPLAVLAEV